MDKRLLFALLLSASWASAKEGSQGNVSPFPEGISPEDFQKQIRKSQEESLNLLKERDPAAYAEQVARLEAQDKVQKILEQARAGELSKEDAKKKLMPLVRKQVGPELQGLDQQLDAAEKRVVFLKAVKKDPDVLVERRVEEMLGLRTFEPAAPMFSMPVPPAPPGP